jgi:uncharacterized protein (TIGR02453 family)
MTQISKTTLQFLRDIKKHNNRQWFLKNKPPYRTAKQELEDFVKELLHAMGSYEPDMLELESKRCVFWIYRDARFSHNKAPYKTNLGAILMKGYKRDMHERAGYYLHVQPGSSFLAGGAYLPPSPWLTEIREHIVDKPKVFKKIINAKSFTDLFSLEGERLKTAPRGYPKDHPEIELLRYKSFLAMHPCRTPC